MLPKRIISAFLLFGLHVQVSFSATTKEDLTITVEQKLKLDELKEIMYPLFPNDYMKTELYLISWLRVNKFEVPAAEKMLREHLTWREENKMDSILDEDWATFDQEYRVNIEGCDEEGRPIVGVFVGEWSFRKAIIAGNGRRIARYLAKMLEEMLLIQRIMLSNGNIITRINLVLDLSQFSLREQGCPRCIPILVNFFTMVERHFPLAVNSILAVNTPQIAIPIWENFLKPVTPEEIRKLLYIYGKNNKDWIRDYKKHGIAIHNLSPELGGTGCPPLDIFELRQNGKNFTCPQC